MEGRDDSRQRATDIDLPAGWVWTALVTHPHHNYYEGRSDADLTPWLEYFVGLLARVFRFAQEEALRMAEPPPAEPAAIQRLDGRARRVLALFAATDRVTAGQVAQILGLSPRMARNLLQGWVDDGWLVVADPSKRGRAYALSAIYRQYIGNLTAMPSE